MTHPLLEKAAQHLAQARAINDEFEGKAMPAEAARQMDAHLAKSTEYRSQVTREAQLKANEEWLSEPEYKHDMTGGERIAEGFGHGAPLLESERKDLEQKAFLNFVRKGEAGLSKEEKAALVEDADGIKIIPRDYAGTILKTLPREATIRNLATVRPTNRLFVDVGNVTVNGGGWGKLETGDTATDPLGTPNVDTIRVHDLNALVKLGNDELEDADNLEAIIREALVEKFAEQEDDAFAAGTGDSNKMPWGITHGVTQNVAAAAGETVVGDDLVALTYKVAARFRRNGVFLGHSSVEQAVALLKGSDGHYLWRESLSADNPPTLLGYKWYAVDGLPAMAAIDDTGAGTNNSLVFGDVKSGYMIADRRQLKVVRLVERYADEGKVGLLFTHRVGGDVIRPAALATYKL